ncbi:MAG: MFS transporter [Pseudomonadota bacterium]
MPGIVALCAAYVFSQFYRAFLAVMTPVLSADFGMTATEFAYASGAWFVAFALFQFPVGILLDKVGPRKTAGVIFTVFTGIGTFLFALASDPGEIIIAMGLIGIGCSVALMAPMYIFVRSYDATRFATLVSVFIGIGTLGNIASSEPLAAAIEIFGWRETCIVLGFGSVIVGIAIFLLVEDPDRAQVADQSDSFFDLLKIRELWPIFPIILGGYIVAGGLRGSWIGPLHTDLYGYDTLQIGRATLYMAIALVLGTFFYGPLDRILNSRKKVVMSGNLLVLGCCILMAVSLPTSPLWGSFAFVFLGFFGASYAVQMAHGKSFIPQHLAGRGVTLLNFCSIGGAGIFQWISGPVVETFGAPGDPRSQYSVLFTYYAIVVTAAILAYSFSKDAKPRSEPV